jgi:hypothetical protein
MLSMGFIEQNRIAEAEEIAEKAVTLSKVCMQMVVNTQYIYLNVIHRTALRSLSTNFDVQLTIFHHISGQRQSVSTCTAHLSAADGAVLRDPELPDEE